MRTSSFTCNFPTTGHRLKAVSTAWITVPIKAWQSGFTVQSYDNMSSDEMSPCGRKGKLKQPLLTKDSKDLKNMER